MTNELLLVHASDVSTRVRTIVDGLVATHRDDLPNLLRLDWDRLRTHRVFVIVSSEGRDDVVRLAAWTGPPTAARPELWIHPERRGNGLGRAAIERLGEVMRHAGATAIDTSMPEWLQAGAPSKLLARLSAVLDGSPPNS